MISPISCGFESAEELVSKGPTVRVKIGLHLLIPGREFPALVDTGANSSSIDEVVAQSLGLPAIDDEEEVSGFHGPARVRLYLATIEVPGLQLQRSGRFAAGKLTEGNAPQRAILGRDFLQHFSMRYHGPSGLVTLQRK